MNDEPYMAITKALSNVKLNLEELVRQRAEWENRWRQEVMQRQEWQDRHREAITERDAARLERDAARAEANAQHMSP